jgi:hypothetical protein
MVFLPLKSGKSYTYLGFANGPLIDYGLSFDLVPLHEIFAFEF